MTEIAESRKTVAAWIVGNQWFPLVQEKAKDGTVTRSACFETQFLNQGWKRIPDTRVANAAACEAEAVRLFGARPADLAPGKIVKLGRTGEIVRALLAVQV